MSPDAKLAALRKLAGVSDGTGGSTLRFWNETATPAAVAVTATEPGVVPAVKIALAVPSCWLPLVYLLRCRLRLARLRRPATITC